MARFTEAVQPTESQKHTHARGTLPCRTVYVKLGKGLLLSALLPHPQGVVDDDLYRWLTRKLYGLMEFGEFYYKQFYSHFKYKATVRHSVRIELPRSKQKCCSWGWEPKKMPTREGVIQQCDPSRTIDVFLEAHIEGASHAGTLVSKWFFEQLC